MTCRTLIFSAQSRPRRDPGFAPRGRPLGDPGVAPWVIPVSFDQVVARVRVESAPQSFRRLRPIASSYLGALRNRRSSPDSKRKGWVYGDQERISGRRVIERLPAV